MPDKLKLRPESKCNYAQKNSKDGEGNEGARERAGLSELGGKGELHGDWARGDWLEGLEGAFIPYWAREERERKQETCDGPW